MNLNIAICDDDTNDIAIMKKNILQYTIETDNNIVVSSYFSASDISVKNIEDEICTVGDISLVYDINGVCQLLGYPVYFSNAKDNEHGIYDYTLVQGQSLDAQIGFCVDPALLQIDNMDLSKLYLSVNFNGDEENRQFIDLRLE